VGGDGAGGLAEDIAVAPRKASDVSGALIVGAEASLSMGFAEIPVLAELPLKPGS
jgi:hypothetical protein